MENHLFEFSSNVTIQCKKEMNPKPMALFHKEFAKTFIQCLFRISLTVSVLNITPYCCHSVGEVSPIVTIGLWEDVYDNLWRIFRKLLKEMYFLKFKYEGTICRTFMRVYNCRCVKVYFDFGGDFNFLKKHSHNLTLHGQSHGH